MINTARYRKLLSSTDSAVLSYPIITRPSTGASTAAAVAAVFFCFFTALADACGAATDGEDRSVLMKMWCFVCVKERVRMNVLSSVTYDK